MLGRVKHPGGGGGGRVRTSLEKGNDDSCGETEQGQRPQHMEKPVIVFICSPPRPCVCGVCVCEGGLSFSQVLGGDLRLQGLVPGGSP